MPKIKVYSSPACPYCVALKEFLKEHKIEFEEVDVTQSQEAVKVLVERTGQMGVPVAEIDGEIVIGFDREKISQLLNIKE